MALTNNPAITVLFSLKLQNRKVPLNVISLRGTFLTFSDERLNT